MRHTRPPQTERLYVRLRDRARLLAAIRQHRPKLNQRRTAVTMYAAFGIEAALAYLRDVRA